MVEKTHRIKFTLFRFLVGAFLFLQTAPAQSSDQLALISDVETQSYLASVIKPLYQAAHLSFNENNVFLVKDNTLNAFVSDGNLMFVNTGTLLSIGNTNELSGILAHETGHIMGGHIVRQKLKMRKMQYLLLGSALAAGATAVSTGRGDAAMAVLLGSQSSALSHMLHYQVQEERNADESALKLLAKTNQSPAGLLNFMNKIKKNNMLSGISETDYFSTHPLTSERISHFSQAASKLKNLSSAHRLDNDLKLIQAKLSGFLETPAQIQRRYPQANATLAAQYAHSILAFRQGKLTAAINLVDQLIDKQPKNPYFYELKGQFLFESGRVKESQNFYQKALSLRPETPLFQIMLAHSILEGSPDNMQLNRAITLLNKSLVKSPSPLAWQLLAQAHGEKGNTAMSLYASAEFNYAIGNLTVAKRLIDNAAQNTADKTLALKIADLQQRLKEDLDEE